MDSGVVEFDMDFNQLQPVEPLGSTENAGQAQGQFWYDIQFEYQQLFPWQQHQIQQHNDEWTGNFGQVAQDLQPAEVRAYSEPQEYAVPLEQQGQREDQREDSILEKQTSREAKGDSHENQICLNDDSLDEQPTGDEQPTIVEKPTREALPATEEKPKSCLAEYMEVTKRMENGNWEGLNELRDLFAQLQRQWPGRYDCISQRWYVNKTNPSLSYCMSLNGGSIKRSWELLEIMRKERADEAARISRSRERHGKPKGLVAPKPTTKTTLQKRKRTSNAESSNQPAAKQAKTTTKPKAATTPKAISESKGISKKTKVAGGNEASGRSKAAKGTRNIKKAVTKPVAQPAPVAETETVGLSRSSAESKTVVAPRYPAELANFGLSRGLSRSAAENTKARASPAPMVEDVEMGGNVDAQVQGDDWTNALFEGEGEEAPAAQPAPAAETETVSFSRPPAENVEAQASPEPMAEDNSVKMGDVVDAQVQGDDWTAALFEEEDWTNGLFEEKGEEAPKDQVAAEPTAESPIENAPTKQVDNQEPEEHTKECPRILESMPAEAEADDGDDALEADFQAELERQQEIDEDFEVDEESDVEQDNGQVDTQSKDINEAPQQLEGMPSEAEDDDWDVESELEEQMEVDYESEVSEEE